MWHASARHKPQASSSASSAAAPKMHGGPAAGLRPVRLQARRCSRSASSASKTASSVWTSYCPVSTAKRQLHGASILPQSKVAEHSDA